MSQHHAPCLVCHKSRPLNSFLQEFNPPGQYLTCRTCISKGEVYCPIHKQHHPKSVLLPVKFQIGQACPLAKTVPMVQPEVVSIPVPEAPTSAPIGQMFEKTLSLIAARLGDIKPLADRMSLIEAQFVALTPLLEGIVEHLGKQPVYSANPSTISYDEVSQLTQQLTEAKEAEQYAINECEKAEQRAASAEEQMRSLEAERDEAKQALESILMSQQSVLAIAQQLDQFANKLD